MLPCYSWDSPERWRNSPRPPAGSGRPGPPGCGRWPPGSRPPHRRPLRPPVGGRTCRRSAAPACGRPRSRSFTANAPPRSTISRASRLLRWRGPNTTGRTKQAGSITLCTPLEKLRHRPVAPPRRPWPAPPPDPPAPPGFPHRAAEGPLPIPHQAPPPGQCSVRRESVGLQEPLQLPQMLLVRLMGTRITRRCSCSAISRVRAGSRCCWSAGQMLPAARVIRPSQALNSRTAGLSKPTGWRRPRSGRTGCRR